MISEQCGKSIKEKKFEYSAQMSETPPEVRQL